ncbi:hypothetical protein [Rhizobium laguerreae]|uniref:hypothetical protein n=1 Tax=Rhizobium laguerreae TaxID=1076926 RepID=UPI001C914103|nr:hypothetical protein [Rhizobium laguerreae]MBY3313878.1 hypothetical protein [Rhizobium laguerreae]
MSSTRNIGKTVQSSPAIDGETTIFEIEPKNPMFSGAPFSDGVLDGIAFREKYF